MKTIKYIQCRSCHTTATIEVNEIETSDELAKQIADLLAGNYALDYRNGHRSTAYPSTPLGELVRRYVSVLAIEETRGSDEDQAPETPQPKHPWRGRVHAVKRA